MYKVWFEGFIDRYFKGYDNAREACVKFIKMTEKDADAQDKLLNELDMFDDTAICGIREIEIMDEVPAYMPQTPEKKKYKVIFRKSEAVEVLAYNEEEAEVLADRVLDNIAFCWEGPADEVIIEEVQ
jgi:K+/H+ antiporter YhaU regulatory subunit KhtT